MLIDLPSYSNEYNLKTDTDNKFYIQNYKYIGGGDNFSVLNNNINPLLIHKNIGLISYNNDIYYDVCTNSSINDNYVNKFLQTQDLNYRLWTESFVGKKFMLIIPSDKITKSNNVLYIPQNIYIRGLRHDIKYADHIGNNDETHQIKYKTYHVYQEDSIDVGYLLEYKMFKQGIIINNVISAKCCNTSAGEYSYTPILDYKSQVYNIYTHTNSSGDYTLPNPLIILSFICKSNHGTTTYNPETTASLQREHMYDEIYWELDNYTIYNGDIDSDYVIAENKVRYF